MWTTTTIWGTGPTPLPSSPPKSNPPKNLLTLKQPILRPPKPEDNPKIKRKYDKRKKEQHISSCQKITTIFKPVPKVPPIKSVLENVSDMKKKVQKPVETSLQGNSDKDKFSHIHVDNDKFSHVQGLPAPDLASNTFISTQPLNDKSCGRIESRLAEPKATNHASV